MTARLGGCRPGNLGIDTLIGEHAVLALGSESGILRALGIGEQRLLAID